MDEDLSIINTSTRNEKIKNFLVNYKKIIIILSIFIIFVIVGVFSFDKYNSSKKKEISDNFNSVIIDFSEASKNKTKEKLIKIINTKDPTYSILSLNFIIDNNLIEDQNEVNSLFDIVLNISLDKEIKNLLIYKKALFNADNLSENDLLNILKPLINSESIWQSQALYLMAEYLYSNNQKEKSKEFFNKIIELENSNQDIRVQAQKRLSRDLSE